jgi:beta-glucanase (GH16 family)
MKNLSPFLGLLLFAACTAKSTANGDLDVPSGIVIKAADYIESSGLVSETDSTITVSEGGWLSFMLPVAEAGRYRVTITGSPSEDALVWLEDYPFNADGRTYNITGNIAAPQGIATVDGSPLDTGSHPIKFHVAKGQFALKNITFDLLYPHKETPSVLTQSMEGTTWTLVWSDEFEGTGLPDTTKWSYNVGNWGWGNNEPQYYTDQRTQNARLENGNLIIEAHQDDMGYPWTSARLTTAGKVAFTYGKIEFRAKVPVGRGTWSAGWLLGAAYRDELSWPYCGEIDVLECVGFEINDTTGAGLNHASCHTRAYYFKQNNQITATTPVENMNTEWHTYSIEWYPTGIRAYVDDVHYYTYDKTANALEWPFNDPQAIILNLAVGGGWGGAQGIDSTWRSHAFVLDYVRVYELQ